MKKINLKELSLIEKGCHGKIYMLGGNLCIKICKEAKDMQM